MIDKDKLIKALDDPLKFVLYFEESGFDKPHYYIILPTRDKNEIIILSMITSQIDKKLKVYKDDKVALESLLYVDGEILDFLIKESLIDCNTPFKTNIDEILKKDKLSLKKANIPLSLVKDIAKKINNSKAPRLNLKKSIDLSKLSDQ
nr:MAG TPA: hypothetical protein [Caudoviricetes sp.]